MGHRLHSNAEEYMKRKCVADPTIQYPDIYVDDKLVTFENLGKKEKLQFVFPSCTSSDITDSFPEWTLVKKSFIFPFLGGGGPWDEVGASG